MTRVAIFPDSTPRGLEFRAIAGDKQSVGRTAGEALDALTPQLPASHSATVIIVQSREPDEYFSALQQARLSELMTRWRAARDASQSLSAGDQAELDALVETELQASARRSQRLLQELDR